VQEPPADTGVLSASLLLRPARTGNAFESTVHRLVQSIRLGLVAPGDRLPPERELAAMLGVSRDTVREAIASLAEAGYLAARRGRYGGTFVVDPVPSQERDPTVDPRGVESAAVLRDTLALRAVLEVGAVRRLAATELSAADRDRVWRAFEDCRDATHGDYRVQDSRFHLLLGELVGAPSLVPLLADVRLRLNAHLDRIPLLAPNIEHSNRQHEAIVAAVLKGQPEAATLAMEEHLEGSEQLLVGFLA